jgi:hypothetical protein
MTGIRTTTIKRERKSHIWEREANEHYVEPAWCSARLFEEEDFGVYIHDPACGFGTIVCEAVKAGMTATGSDIVDRGFDGAEKQQDFLTADIRRTNIVTNPPFNLAPQFALRALGYTQCKVAIIFPTACLNAANGVKGKYWIAGTPLRRVWLMTPRPSMPPGEYIAAGQKPGGGRVDFCWLVWEHGYRGAPELRWLHRDAPASRTSGAAP